MVWTKKLEVFICPNQFTSQNNEITTVSNAYSKEPHELQLILVAPRIPKSGKKNNSNT